MFRTTAFVVGAYVLFWAPCNVWALLRLLDTSLALFFSDHLFWLEGLILVNVVLNPFLCRFGEH